jgi:hypothetical protein
MAGKKPPKKNPFQRGPGKAKPGKKPPMPFGDKEAMPFKAGGMVRRGYGKARGC